MGLFAGGTELGRPSRKQAKPLRHLAGAFCARLFRPQWIEDELVRCGARDARLIDEDVVAVTVAAQSSAEANELVRVLLARVGVSKDAIVQPVAPARA